MKKSETNQMQEIQGGGWNPRGCAMTIAGGILTFATIPTGFGGALLLMGGATLFIAGVADNCQNPNR